MKFPVWCELVCRQCAGTCAGRFNWTKLNKVALKNEALKSGWKIIANDWICKACLGRSVPVSDHDFKCESEVFNGSKCKVQCRSCKA